MRKLVLFFDSDDTILDFDKAETGSITHLFEDYNLLSYPNIVQKFKEINLGVWHEYEKNLIEKKDIGNLRFIRLFEFYGITNFDVEQTSLDYWKYLSQAADLIPGAIDMLEKIYKQHDLYVITNGMGKVQTMRCEKAGINKYFIKKYISGEMNAKKPEKEFFEYIDRDLNGINRDVTYIIGDSLTSDILGGNIFNIKTIWFNRKNEINTTRAKPDYEVKNYQELLKLFNDLSKE